MRQNRHFRGPWTRIYTHIATPNAFHFISNNSNVNPQDLVCILSFGLRNARCRSVPTKMDWLIVRGWGVRGVYQACNRRCVWHAISMSRRLCIIWRHRNSCFVVRASLNHEPTLTKTVHLLLRHHSFTMFFFKLLCEFLKKCNLIYLNCLTYLYVWCPLSPYKVVLYIKTSLTL